jgi:hypothetical protein
MMTQEEQRFFGQGHVAIPLALASADMEEPALRVNVAHRQSQAFAQPQAAGIEGDQGHAMIQGGHALEDGAHLLGREHHRQFVVWIGADQLDLGGPAAAQGFFPEELDGADGLGGGLAGDLFLALEEDEVLAELFGGDLLGGFGEVLGELADAGPVGRLGGVADRQEPEVIGEGF